MKAADPTMFEAVSKPELPVTHPVEIALDKNKQSKSKPLPRISTDCPSKSAGSIDTDSYPCSVVLYHVVPSMEFPVPLHVLFLKIAQEYSGPTFQY